MAPYYCLLLVIILGSLSSCSQALSTTDQTTAPVSTASPFAVRLVNGATNISGRVEVFYDGQWGTVCDDDWGHNDALVVCRMIGYSHAYSVGYAYFGAGTGPIWMDDVGCDGSEQSLDECQFNGWGTENCGHHEDAGVICFIGNQETDIDIRLSGGPDPNVGRVEVYYGGYWGGVCYHNWDDSDTAVACRMLGYSGGKEICRADGFGRPLFPRWMSHVDCNGAEDSLADCSFDGWGYGGSCRYPANVFCYNVTETDIDFRLSGSPGPHIGRLDAYHSGYWGGICYYNWDDNDTAVACRMLGYSAGYGIYRTSSFGSLLCPVWMSHVDCKGTEDSLADCSFDGWGYGGSCSYPVNVFCYNATETDIVIRLREGPGPYAGRVDVYYSGYWGGICYYNWDDRDSAVACRMLGYSAGYRLYTSSHFGRPLIPVWMSGVDCNGTEDSLADCSFDGWGYSDSCYYPVNVVCYNDTETDIAIRLSGGPDPNVGRVDVYYGGYWGGICSTYWDDRDSVVACRMLGYRVITQT